jgi:hypothetical protein
MDLPFFKNDAPSGQSGPEKNSGSGKAKTKGCCGKHAQAKKCDFDGNGVGTEYDTQKYGKHHGRNGQF